MRGLEATSVTPDALTVAGVLLCIVGAVVVYFEYASAWLFLAGAALFVVGSVLDILDGALARTRGTGTPFGAFLDSTVDRVADAALFIGTALLAVASGQPALLWWALLALLASFLVPYVRAKAESLGVAASVGPAPREAHIVIFLLGLAAWALAGLEGLFVAGVLAVALLASITATVRVAHVARQLQTKGR